MFSEFTCFSAQPSKATGQTLKRHCLRATLGGPQSVGIKVLASPLCQVKSVTKTSKLSSPFTYIVENVIVVFHCRDCKVFVFVKLFGIIQYVFFILYVLFRSQRTPYVSMADGCCFQPQCCSSRGSSSRHVLPP